MSFADRVLMNLNFACQKFGPFVCTAILQSACNGWPTTRRFRMCTRPCRFGCGQEAGDRIDHYFGCPLVVPLLCRLFRLLPDCYHQWDFTRRIFIHDMWSLTSDGLHAYLILPDILLSVYNALRIQDRQGPEWIESVIRARARAIARRSARVRAVLSG